MAWEVWWTRRPARVGAARAAGLPQPGARNAAGVALGDALGAPVDGMGAEAVREAYGAAGITGFAPPTTGAGPSRTSPR
ncbi:hypothetical protein ACR6C2_20645 [Streptomyces sp. INA 01156]